MFKNWGVDTEEIKTDGNGKKGVHEAAEPARKESTVHKAAEHKSSTNDINTILKGSKLTGDINVTCDLNLSGDVEGNITSEQKSNIVIQGTCKGNIVTRDGSVEIKGEQKGGNITAGRNVTILGKFSGGEATAAGKIYVNGEFTGKLEGDEIEIGPNAVGKGELFYREYISISKGAKIEAQINRVQKELKVVKSAPAQNVVEMKPQEKEIPVNEKAQNKENREAQ
jgi:cytoskeletal protein CcmA (bactofilin family)